MYTGNYCQTASDY